MDRLVNLRITQKAQEKLKEVLTEQKKPAAAIRLFIQGIG